MTQNGRRSEGQQPERALGRTQHGKEGHRYVALQDVHQHHRERCLPAQNPKRVGGAQVPTSLLAEIHTVRRSPHPEARRDGPQRVGKDEKRCGDHAGVRSRDEDERTRMRRGTPMKVQARRKPLWR